MPQISHPVESWLPAIFAASSLRQLTGNSSVTWPRWLSTTHQDFPRGCSGLSSDPPLSSAFLSFPSYWFSPSWQHSLSLMEGVLSKKVSSILEYFVILLELLPKLVPLSGLLWVALTCWGYRVSATPYVTDRLKWLFSSLVYDTCYCIMISGSTFYIPGVVDHTTCTFYRRKTSRGWCYVVVS